MNYQENTYKISNNKSKNPKSLKSYVLSLTSYKPHSDVP